MNADYDPTQPKYMPIIASITATIVVILAMTIALIYYFKAIVSTQYKMNENTYGQYIELDQLRAYENTHLSSGGTITIDEAIYIISRTYN